MQKAVPPGEGAMAALLGFDVEAARRIAAAASQRPGRGVRGSQRQCPGQVVVSGHRHAVERAIAIARERAGVQVDCSSGQRPFHSPLMAPAAEVMQKALDEAALRPPVVPLVTNVSASEINDPAEIKRQLVRSGYGDGAVARKRALPRDGGGRGGLRDRDWSRACRSG